MGSRRSSSTWPRRKSITGRARPRAVPTRSAGRARGDDCRRGAPGLAAAVGRGQAAQEHRTGRAAGEPGFAKRSQTQWRVPCDALSGREDVLDALTLTLSLKILHSIMDIFGGIVAQAGTTRPRRAGRPGRFQGTQAQAGTRRKDLSNIRAPDSPHPDQFLGGRSRRDISSAPPEPFETKGVVTQRFVFSMHCRFLSPSALSLGR